MSADAVNTDIDFDIRRPLASLRALRDRDASLLMEPPAPLWLYAVTMARLRIASLWCRVAGHKMVCDAVTTPETGYEDFYCDRCGWTDHITYY